mgnify:CR=1 FL=1
MDALEAEGQFTAVAYDAAGASAGGINAIFLADAISTDQYDSI